ncbi:MAG: FAD-dependent oxidoreductase, partial [Acidimicrobiia bacterium]|nr:FAD-dependent oxidoreductase [Acidimicrobiia bacterium]
MSSPTRPASPSKPLTTISGWSAKVPPPSRSAAPTYSSSTGRTPNSNQLGLEYLNLDPDSDGYLPIDERLHTDVDSVWALGDLRGGPMFTHAARHDADVVAGNLFQDADRTIAGRVVPHAVFVDPEVASVGLTEAHA